MAKLKRLFKRVVPESWERELNDISPSQNRFVWLKLIYEEGHPWEPVERYMLYQMTPERLMVAGLMPDILEQLKDPDPPSAHGNYYDTVKEEFVRDPNCLITERAWHLYRETGCWGRPYWVIQGERGGHKRWFTRAEQQLLRFAKLPTEPPAPGDLPYAEWDERVKEKLLQLDVLRGEHGERRRTAALAKGHSALEEKEKELQLELRQKLLGFLKEQVTEIGDEATKALLKVDAGRVRRDRFEQARIEEGMEKTEDNFLTTGSRSGLIVTR